MRSRTCPMTRYNILPLIILLENLYRWYRFSIDQPWYIKDFKISKSGIFVTLWIYIPFFMYTYYYFKHYYELNECDSVHSHVKPTWWNFTAMLLFTEFINREKNVHWIITIRFIKCITEKKKNTLYKNYIVTEASI